MTLLDRFARWFRPEPIVTAEALAEFMDSRAAFMAQKCVVEYCRARSGVLWQKLFKERAFLDALNRSRWTSYAIVYCDIAEMVEGQLRRYPGEASPMLCEALAGLGRRTFARYGQPDGVGDDFWDAAAERLERRLARAQLHRPRPVRELPKTDLEAIFASLPIHASLRGHDFELVQNNLRTNLVRIYEDFIAAADPERLRRALAEIAAEPGAGAGTPAVAAPAPGAASGRA